MFTDYSPCLPYEKKLKGNVNPGFKFTINGHVPADCTNFTINLKCGNQRPGYPEPNLALHLAVRFNEGVIVRNSKISSGAAVWGPEERTGGIPLCKNQPFQIDIIAEAYAFKINVNNNHFTEFKYRLPINTISWLEISGHVTIYQINGGMIGAAPANQAPPYSKRQHGNRMSRGPPPPYTPYQPTPQVTPQPYIPYQPTPQVPPQTPGLPIHVNSPATPTTIYIPGNMQVGMCFSFSGVTHHGAQRFHINWNTMNGDAALHFNPRMNEYVVVRTSRQHGKYSTEERHGGTFPFYPGQVFHMLVRVHHSHYEVMVNSQLFTTFNHHIHPITAVNSITIDGGVSMHTVNITQ